MLDKLPSQLFVAGTDFFPGMEERVRLTPLRDPRDPLWTFQTVNDPTDYNEHQSMQAGIHPCTNIHYVKRYLQYISVFLSRVNGI